MLIKKIVKYTSISLLILIGLFCLYLTTAYCFSRVTIEKEPIASNEIVIYIKTNGVHTDIVVPIRTSQIDWSKEIKFEHTQSKDSNATYLGMGWGDKGFYLETPEWSDLKASVAFKAAFALSTTAIHATFYRHLNENETCKKIMLSKEQYSRLITYIRKSFKENNEGHYILIDTDANYSEHDAFYEAIGSYSFLHTCNTWTNNSLKACGQKACLWTIFDTGIFLKYN